MIDSAKVILQGGGDHARVVLDCLLEMAVNVVGIFDPNRDGELFGVPQLGAYQPSLHPDAKAVIAIGDNAIRKEVVEKCKHGFITVKHPGSSVSSRSQIDEGSMILQRSVIQANSRIGKHVIINTAAQVDHDCNLADFVHLAPGAILCGNITVGEGSFIGAGAVVIPGMKIGKWATIGAGTVVIENVPDRAVVVGSPGKIIKYNP